MTFRESRCLRASRARALDRRKGPHKPITGMWGRSVRFFVRNTRIAAGGASALQRQSVSGVSYTVGRHGRIAKLRPDVWHMSARSQLFRATLLQGGFTELQPTPHPKRQRLARQRSRDKVARSSFLPLAALSPTGLSSRPAETSFLLYR